MKTLLIILGILWASPTTLLNFMFHVGPLWLLRAYSYAGTVGPALIWHLRPEADLWWGVRWVAKLWKGWGANAIGNIIVMHALTEDWESSRTIIHELEHTNQAMRMGPFFLPLYGLVYLIGLGLRGTHPYYDSIFELSARRSAGQVVDVIGLTEHIKNR